MRILADAEVIIITAQLPDEFTKKINDVIRHGLWRILATEMSITDHHYYALLVRQTTIDV